MARSGKTAQEFIRDSFSPIIAVLCSPKVETVVSKNNLSFTELLQPFTGLEWEGQFREPGGSVCTIKNWKLIVRDVNWKPLQPTEARRQLNNAVLHNYHDKTVSFDLGGRKFDIPQSTYWFDAWRETYLEVQFPSDHEFTKHFLSCIIVGVAHDENVIESFHALNQQYAQLQNVTPPKLPKWFNSGVLKSYLLIHDASVISREKADVQFEILKQTFGESNCFILSINSKSASDPILTDMWAPFVKRTSEANNEMSSSLTQATTPAEAQTVFSPSNIGNEEGIGLSSEISHPLSSPDNDFYDNANSLQTHSFSGSAESVSVMSRVLDCSTEVHGTCLNSNDIDDIKKFLQDYAQKALLPYLEKQIAQLSEVVANRKGVSRSLLSATKRWFGTGKTGNTTANNTVIYTSDCPELQLRRLGDLWFMCGQWNRAFDAYHTAKREFYADSAFLFYAGALEMAAISAFMAGDANRKTHGYMEESIVTYLNTCRMVQYAVRATLLSVLCLNSAGQHGEAAKQFIRMTSEDSDLRSAMLLEQAALCFLSGPGAKAMCRKYAFHMVLAGHRFSKAGQRKHAYRCYKQAYQVYGESGWHLASQHVQFALGRLASTLHRAKEALAWLAAPLAPPAHPAPAHQDTRQQAAFLREYIMAHQQWIENSDELKDGRTLPLLPLPLVSRRETAVLCVGPAPLSSPGRQAASSVSLASPPSPAEDRVFARLEEMLLQVAQGAVPMIFKPTVEMYRDGTDCDPVVPQGEPIQISITLWNPLKIPLVLKDVELLWAFVDSTSETFNNEPALASGGSVDGAVIAGQKIKSILLEGDSKKAFIFTLTPLRVGSLNFHGMAYKLVNVGENGNEGVNGATITGKVELTSGVKSMDRRLQINVIPEAPCLQMTFSETNPNILSGEVRCIDVELSNGGAGSLQALHLAVSHPHCLAATPHCDHSRQLYEDKYSDPPDYPDERAARTAAWRKLAAKHVVALPSPGARGRVRLRLRALHSAPTLHVLAYYETGLPAPAYRLRRHVFHFNVTRAVDVSVIPRRTLRTVNSVATENMALTVEVKNIGEKKDVSVELLEASLLSRSWRLIGLVAAGSRNDPLLPHERLHLIFQAERLPPNDVPAEGKVDQSQLNITESNYDKLTANVPALTEFLTDGDPAFPETNDSLNTVTQEKSNSRTGLIKSMFVLRWKADDKSENRTSIGQHCIWLDCFSNKTLETIPRTPTEHIPQEDSDKLDIDTKQSKENVVIFGLEHTNEIKHDFKERKLCSVPVTLNIVNCYSIPVNVFIDMNKQKNIESTGTVGWAGALCGGAGAGSVGVNVQLARQESRRVLVSALCGAPGTYLLGAAFTATATLEGASNSCITHPANNASLLVVRPV